MVVEVVVVKVDVVVDVFGVVDVDVVGEDVVVGVDDQVDEVGVVEVDAVDVV